MTENNSPFSIHHSPLKMELMSPAGNYEALKRAIEGGADAVYLGLPFFNARKPAKNFGISEITEAIEFAHNNNVKVYVTLNIDLKTSELKLLSKILILLTEISVDAIIIKDLALLYLIRNYFSEPNQKTIPIHISTQFGVANSRTLMFLKKKFPLIERVVLAREINFEELKIIGNIDKDIIPELEVFVQGSMCFSFSGKCLLSSFVGGKSANRGVCQAPCRVKYSINDNQDPTSLFSMKDLSLVNYIKELDECNITALKIEGRLKNPAWVKEITSIYRDTLDYYYSDVDKSVKLENNFQKREEKLKLYSGRELNSGFLFEIDDLTSDHNVHFGKKLGKVLSVDIEKGMIEFSFTEKKPDTSLRFVFENKFLGILHNITLNNNTIKVEKNNQELIDKIKENTLVYEVIVNSVVEKKETDKVDKKIKKVVGMNRYNLILDLLEDKNELKITIETDEREIVVFEKYKKVVKAKRAVHPELLYDLLIDRHFNGWRIKEFDIVKMFQISKSQVNNLVSTVSREIAIVNKDLNLKGIKILDKELIEDLTVVSSSSFDIEVENLYNNLEISYSNANSLKITGSDLENFLFEWDNLTAFDKNRTNQIVNIIVNKFNSEHFKELENFISTNKNVESIVIAIFPIIFENEIIELENLIKKIEKLDNNKIKISYEINDFGHLEILEKYKISKDRVLCGSGISAYNIFAVKTLKNLGLNSFHIPLEIDKMALSDLMNFVNKNSNNKMKIRMDIFSRIPLYYSRVESDKFNSESVYEDSINTKIISTKFNDITIFESEEFYNISKVKFDSYQKVNELIIDLSNEKNIINKYLQIKNKNYPFSNELSFNFDRKLF